MLAHLLAAVCTSVFGAVGCQQDRPTGVPTARPQADAVPARDTTLAPTADTYIRRLEPNRNQGAEPILRLTALGKNRALLRWDQQTLTQAVGGGTVTAARLELTIAELADNWSAAGRPVKLHRMTHDWTELGATWNCAVDTAPADHRPSCTGATAWNMDDSASYPWVATPTATALLKNGQTGLVSFDVTADVQAWLAGQSNDGWILKKTVEGDPGRGDFRSREGTSGPLLLLTVVTDTVRPPIPTSDRPDDSLYLVRDPVDTVPIYYRRLFDIVFADSTSGGTIRAFLLKYGAEIVSGLPLIHAYTVRTSDPGEGWSAYQARIHAMQAEPGITLVSPLKRRDYRVHLNSRFPADGPGLDRASWFNGSGLRWALNAIRAPLAWGCEDGEYGGHAPSIGVLEMRFDTAEADLRGSSPTLYSVSRELAPPEPDSVIAGYELHGTIVAGVATAEGDNGVGATGVIWRTRLHLYAAGSLDNRAGTDNARSFTLQLGPQLIADRPRVLNISISVGGKPSDSTNQAVLRAALTQVLEQSPNTLIVVAAGNDDSVFTPQAYLESPAPQYGLTAALLYLKMHGFADRILFVAGTMRGSTRWHDAITGQGSNVIRGQTDIAAPAESVVSIAPSRFGPQAIAIGSGTSASAPLVAGVAAQLLAMDSTLTPARVRDYIVRGAQQKRLNSTGDSVLPQPVPVQGAPEPIYQLDAYGSVSLLSRERPGTPICGYPVHVAPGVDQTTVILEPPGAPARSVPVPGAGWATAVSVAQGGRRLAVLDSPSGDTAWRTIVMDQNGTPLATAPFLQRMYLEKDSVDVLWSALPYPKFIMYRSAPDTLDPIGPYVAGDPIGSGFGAVSPTADQVAFYVSGSVRCGAYLAPLTGASAAPVGNNRDCDRFGTEVTWSHDSRRAVLVSQGPGGDGLTTVQSSGLYGEAFVPDTAFWNPLYLPDDSLLRVGEYAGVCEVALRSAADPTTGIGPVVPGRDRIDCEAGANTMTIPNAPARRASNVLSGLNPLALREGHSAFDLGAPERVLQRQAAMARRRWAGFGRVQVN